MRDSRIPPPGTNLDAGAIAALFRDHHAELVRLALFMVGDLPTAEDVVQDVFASLHRRSRALRVEAPLPYVRAAVLNGCRSVLRRRGIARRAGLTHRAWIGDETMTLASAESEVILSEDRSTLRLSQSARYPVIADAVAGPGGELILAALSGPADAATLTVERVDAAGKRLGVLYRSTAYGTVGLPASVTLTPDSTRHYLLLTYNSPNGLVSGWIDHGKLRLLPARHPTPGLLITAW